MYENHSDKKAVHDRAERPRSEWRDGHWDESGRGDSIIKSLSEETPSGLIVTLSYLLTSLRSNGSCHEQVPARVLSQDH